MAPVTMGSPGEQLPRLTGLVAVGQPVPRRLRAFARALTDPDVGAGLLAAHCEVGDRLATELGLPSEVATALGTAYAQWDGRGVPRGIAETDIPQSMRISTVARDAELWTREAGPEAARQLLRRRRGRAYDPEAVDAALELPMSPLDDSPDEDLWQTVVALEPKPQVTVSGTRLMRALAALGDYADLKVPERSGRARRVARLAGGSRSDRGLRQRRHHHPGPRGTGARPWRGRRPIPRTAGIAAPRQCGLGTVAPASSLDGASADALFRSGEGRACRPGSTMSAAMALVTRPDWP